MKYREIHVDVQGELIKPKEWFEKSKLPYITFVEKAALDEVLGKEKTTKSQENLKRALADFKEFEELLKERDELEDDIVAKTLKIAALQKRVKELEELLNPRQLTHEEMLERLYEKKEKLAPLSHMVIVHLKERGEALTPPDREYVGTIYRLYAPEIEK